MDNLLGHMRRSLKWNAVQQWGVQAIRLAVLMVLARMVSSASLGVFAFCSTAVGVVHLFCGQGMTAALVQRHDLEDRHIGAAFAATVSAGMLAAFSLTVSAPLLGHLLSNRGVAPLLRVLAWALPLYALSGMPMALWRRKLDFRRIAVVTTASQLLAALAAIVLAVKGFGVWSLAARMMGEAVLLVLFTIGATPWKLLLRIPYRAYASGYRDLARTGFTIAAVNLMALGRSRLDELLIGSTLGAETLGYYALARREVDGISSLVPAVIANSLAPILARVQLDAAHVNLVMQRGMSLLGTLTLPAFFGIGASASTWVPLFLGPRWAPSVPLIQSLAVVAATRAIVGFSLAALFAIGHPVKRFLMELATTSIVLLITVLALPWGIRTIGWACAAATLLITPIELALISRWIGVPMRDQIRTLRNPLLGASAMLAVVLLVQKCHSPWLGPIVRLSLMVLFAMLILILGYRKAGVAG